MNKPTIVKKTIEMIESGKISDYYFDDNLVVEGVTATKLNKSQYVEFLDKLTNAIPDLSCNCKEIKVKSNELVEAKIRFSGTNTNEFDIPDFPTHPATGKKFKLSQDIMEFHIENNRISKLRMKENYDGGVNGIIRQLGINPY